jgi:hypothetical protein
VYLLLHCRGGCRAEKATEGLLCRVLSLDIDGSILRPISEVSTDLRSLVDELNVINFQFANTGKGRFEKVLHLHCPASHV